MSRYTEHRTLETGPLLVADSTMESGERKVWIGAGGLEGRWVTHAEFRTIVAALVEFAGALPPSGVTVARHQTFRASDADAGEGIGHE